MLTGKALGDAIRKAIELKLSTGKVKTKTEIAKHFGIRQPSLYDWINRGSVDKSHLPAIWQYFSDVVGPEHWGMKELPPHLTASADHAEILKLFDRLTESQRRALLDQLRRTVADNEELLAELSARR